MLHKRKGRSKTIIDLDDAYFLVLIVNKKSYPINEIKSKMDISYKGFLTHRDRLEKQCLIKCFRDKTKHREKYISITLKGIKMVELIKEYIE